LIVRACAVYDDIEDFYRRAPDPRNRLNVARTLLIRRGASRINRGIDAVRSAKELTAS
jgi:hypothetical protein